MFPYAKLLVFSILLSLARTAPADLDKRQSSLDDATAGSGVVNGTHVQEGTDVLDDVDVLNSTEANAEAAEINSSILNAIENTIKGHVTATPANIDQATSALSSILAPTSTDLYGSAIKLVANGFGPKASVLIARKAGTFIGPDSHTNINLRAPSETIYPKKSSSDAPYSLWESQLRQAIHIPLTFTYGKKPPVILVPGTGDTGYETFKGNFIPLLTGVSYADPVWLNVPGQLLGDAQVNAEYVAYAINYINGITQNNVSVISWSQGGIDTQWALKYWPSTRTVTSNFIANSPDFHGTVLAYLLCPKFPELPCPPSVIQQEYESTFIKTLRGDGGDSAYVSTTTIFSATDEIVEPQSPVIGASAFLNDARGVGVTNNQVQAVCGLDVAGTFYTHEGVLYNPLSFALAVDALKNGGPGQISRINLLTVCSEIVSSGLGLKDVLETEESLVIALISILLYQPKVLFEPLIKAYAREWKW